MVSSSSDAFRLIQQGGIRINGEKISDTHVYISKGTSNIYQISKKNLLK